MPLLPNSIQFKRLQKMNFNRHNLTCYLMVAVAILIASGCTPSRVLEERDAREMSSSGELYDVATTDEEYRIRPGDEIEILVWEHEDFDVETTVSRTGSITMPLIGEVSVSGMTSEELESELTERLSEYIAGEVNLAISIRNLDDMQVSVFGMVERPDNYPVVDQTSLFKVLSTAGGPSEEANIRSIRIYRQNGNPNETIDLTRHLDDGSIHTSPILVGPGDIVYVPRRQNAVREMSDFLRDAVMLFGIFRIFN